MREIGRHHRRRAAQEPERARHHSLVALGQKLGDPLGVGFGKNGDGVPIPGAVQFGMGPRGTRALQLPALLVSVRAAPSKLRPWLPERVSQIREASPRRSAEPASTASSQSAIASARRRGPTLAGREVRHLNHRRGQPPGASLTTDSSATSHRERAPPYGRFFSSTSFDFDRPIRSGPIRCDDGSDRSRPRRKQG